MKNAVNKRPVQGWQRVEGYDLSTDQNHLVVVCAICANRDDVRDGAELYAHSEWGGEMPHCKRCDQIVEVTLVD
jgi:hypothetical protein